MSICQMKNFNRKLDYCKIYPCSSTHKSSFCVFLKMQVHLCLSVSLSHLKIDIPSFATLLNKSKQFHHKNFILNNTSLNKIKPSTNSFMLMVT